MGARAFIPLTLAVAILLSIAPATPVAAEEPAGPVLVDPATPVVDPATDLTPSVDPVVTDPTPVPAPVLVDPTPTTDPVAADPPAAPAPVVAAVVTPVVKPKPRGSEAQQIIRIARTKLGRPWVHGATGPRAFDCSGLVIYAFKRAGDGRAIANGHLRSARALYRWYQSRGLASRSNPRVGDLVIWGRGSHVGIYIGHGKAISTLTRGVRVHGVFAVTASFTAYLHTGMWKKPVR
jgi:cell wall-associated NlpC family hydrolase